MNWIGQYNLATRIAELTEQVENLQSVQVFAKRVHGFKKDHKPVTYLSIAKEGRKLLVIDCTDKDLCEVYGEFEDHGKFAEFKKAFFHGDDANVASEILLQMVKDAA